MIGAVRLLSVNRAAWEYPRWEGEADPAVRRGLVEVAREAAVSILVRRMGICMSYQATRLVKDSLRPIHPNPQ